jgi:hypothetical protein
MYKPSLFLFILSLLLCLIQCNNQTETALDILKSEKLFLEKTLLHSNPFPIVLDLY